MKIPLFITTITLALFFSSCRTSLPIDPMTGDPSTRCLPGQPAPYVEPTK